MSSIIASTVIAAVYSITAVLCWPGLSGDSLVAFLFLQVLDCHLVRTFEPHLLISENGYIAYKHP